MDLLELIETEGIGRDEPHILNLFAGPGGWDEGARLAGITTPIIGIETDADACATARAAGHRRIQTDVLGIELEEHPRAQGLLASPPCPTFSPAGSRSSRYDMALLHDVITTIGWWEADEYDEPESWAPVEWSEIEREISRCEDPRTGLFAKALWMATRLPELEWMAWEQVPAARPLFEDMATELGSIGWDTNVVTTQAPQHGTPSRRERVFLLASMQQRHTATWFAPPEGREVTSMATALGWAAGHRVNTRGNRQTAGGNEFSADGPSWCLTEKARSWKRDDGRPLSVPEAGILNGFRADYPWQGSRSKQFLQIADVVPPPVAADIITGASGGAAWQARVDERAIESDRSVPTAIQEARSNTARDPFGPMPAAATKVSAPAIAERRHLDPTPEIPGVDWSR